MPNEILTKDEVKLGLQYPRLPHAPAPDTPKNKGGNPNWYKGMPAPPGAGKQKSPLKLALKARTYGPEIIETLMTIVRDEDEKTTNRIAAAHEVLNRGYGRAPVKIDIGEGDDAQRQEMLDAIQEAMARATATMTGQEYIPPMKDVTPAPVIDQGAPNDEDSDKENPRSDILSGDEESDD